MTSRPRGTGVAAPEVGPELARVLGNLGDANLAGRGVGFGTVRNGTDAGRHDAVWATYNIPTGLAAGTQVFISHTLGRVPTMVSLSQIEGDGHTLVSLTQKTSWSSSRFGIKMHSFTPGPAAPAGLTLVFLVGG